MPIKRSRKEKKVECPRCWVEMVRHEVEVFGPNIEVDICPKCEGTWLDSGELHKLLGDRKLANYLTKEIGTKSESPLVCPRCRHLMDLELADDVEVDVCLNCNGVWLDAGELESLKDRSEEGFEGDEVAKAEERWEEMVARNRKSRFNRFMRGLGR